MIELSQHLRTQFAGADAFDRIMAFQGKIHRDVKHRRTLEMEIGGRRYFIKVHRGCGWGEIFKDLSQGRLPVTGARSEWEALDKLHALGVPTLVVAGKGMRGRNPATCESFLITEALEGMISLETLVQNWAGLTSERRQQLKRALGGELARLARTMHETGMNHRDFYLCHFLVKDRPWMDWQPGSACKLHLIDLHRAQIRRQTPRRWRSKDLAGLLFSALNAELTNRNLPIFANLPGCSLANRFTGKFYILARGMSQSRPTLPQISPPGAGRTAGGHQSRFHMKQFNLSGTRWTTTDDFAPLLESVLNSSGSVIKESAAKRVSRHAIADKSWYQKVYRHQAVPLRPLKYFFRKSPAQQEWDLALQLAQRGVPTVRHVALGETWSATGLRESTLITEAFSGVPLDESARWQPQRLLTFMHHLHEKGVYQVDVHPANILFDEHTGDFCLVDLYGIRLLSNMPQSLRNQNLAVLSIGADLPLPAELLPLRRELRQKILARRARRCLNQNRDFATKRLGRLVWQTRREFISPTVEKILADPDGFLLNGRPLLKDGRSATVGATDNLVIKRNNFSRPLNLIKDLFRHSRAKDSFRKAYHLELTGIRTARGIAAADERTAGFLRRSYFVMEQVPGGMHAHEWRGERRHAIRETARLFARLHDEGFAHRDLKTTNVLLDATGQAWLIDLDGLAFVRNVPPTRAISDVERFERCAASFLRVEKSDRLVFLKHYCRARGLRPKELLARAR